MKDEIESLKITENEFKTLAVYGKSSLSHQINALRNGVDIIVGTPGRLVDLINKN